MVFTPYFIGKVKINWVAALICILAILEVAAIIFLPLYQTRLWGEYLTIHNLLEITTVVISLSVFFVAWGSPNKEFSRNVILLISVFLGIGILDVAHFLSYVGMPDFLTPNVINKSTNLWLAARLMAAAVLLYVIAVPSKGYLKRSSRYLLLISVLMFTGMVFWVLVYLNAWIPPMFVPGKGLTPLKVGIEYAIIALNIWAVLLLLMRHQFFLPFNRIFLMAVVATMAMSEVFFTRYADVSDGFNLLGHLYKVIAYVFLYFAIFVEMVKQPYEQIRKLSRAVEQSPESIVITNLNAEIEYVNEAFILNTGYSFREAIGQNPRILQSGKTPNETYQTLWTTLTGGQIWKGELINKRKDGSEYVELATISPIRNASGNVTHFVALKQDVTSIKEAEAHTSYLAFYDQLTDLPNRVLLLDRLEKSLLSSSHSKKYGAILFVDLDNFKNLNDTLGHDVGDQLLKRVAQRLLASVRESDVVARIGGDEFILLLEGLSEEIAKAALVAEWIAKKILENFHADFLIGQYTCQSTPSIGIALYSGHRFDTVEELLKQADLAMYEAKTAGRNMYRFFDQTMQSALTARTAIEADLRIGLAASQFRLHYQAQFDQLGNIVGAEVLLRLQHPVKGLLLPSQFIKAAEETGLIVPIGKWVLETACLQLAKWANEPSLAGIALSVNISVRQFRDEDFVGKLMAIFDQTDANPNLLTLEPTESLLFEDVENAIQTMSLLRAEGVRFALDDFGTGYSSLSYLKKLPLDKLKIDQSFVREVPNDKQACSIVRAIITLAKSLDLGIIAEGVETEEQRQFLVQNHCEFYQGYLLSRPLPLGDFEALVQSSTSPLT